MEMQAGLLFLDAILTGRYVSCTGAADCRPFNARGLYGNVEASSSG